MQHVLSHLIAAKGQLGRMQDAFIDLQRQELDARGSLLSAQYEERYCIRTNRCRQRHTIDLRLLREAEADGRVAVLSSQGEEWSGLRAQGYAVSQELVGEQQMHGRVRVQRQWQRGFKELAGRCAMFWRGKGLLVLWGRRGMSHQGQMGSCTNTSCTVECGTGLSFQGSGEGWWHGFGSVEWRAVCRLWCSPG